MSPASRAGCASIDVAREVDLPGEGSIVSASRPAGGIGFSGHMIELEDGIVAPGNRNAEWLPPP
jgi:hypothetical protein